MPARDSKALWGRWRELWNGDPAVADETIAPDFVADLAPVGNSPGEVRGPEGLEGQIGGVLAAFGDHEFTTVVGPLIDGDMVAGRWNLVSRAYAPALAGGRRRAVPYPCRRR
jgi:hypothetical protein